MRKIATLVIASLSIGIGAANATPVGVSAGEACVSLERPALTLNTDDPCFAFEELSFSEQAASTERLLEEIAMRFDFGAVSSEGNALTIAENPPLQSPALPAAISQFLLIDDLSDGIEVSILTLLPTEPFGEAPLTETPIPGAMFLWLVGVAGLAFSFGRKKKAA
ncbi:MAG: hypothetical protein AAGD92_00110 [Pseudomonadota bacterium]